jgi:dimethylhistidine N-methyltransferase
MTKGPVRQTILSSFDEAPAVARAADAASVPNVKHLAAAVQTKSVKEEALHGLTADPKTLPAKLFYDSEGSALFERICELPEYYLTRTEAAILRTLPGSLPSVDAIIEPGAGGCAKVAPLLRHLGAKQYIPIDVSAQHLQQAATRVAQEFPEIDVISVAADFETALPVVEDLVQEGERRLVFYPGSSIGNFNPFAACALLRQFRAAAGRAGLLLIGFDLQKDASVLLPAYDDSEGITAAFNLNLLSRLNREADANFVAENFRHVALYDAPQGRIEMHLESRLQQRVRIDGQEIAFAAGERIHTENSYKYTIQEFRALAHAAGFRQMRVWTDAREYFCVGLYVVSVE